MAYRRWFAALVALLFGCSGKKTVQSFFVYYGDKEVSASVLAGYDLAIVEPGHFKIPDAKNNTTRFIAYLSIGEIHESRDYFQKLKNTGALVEKNENWEGAYRIDVRDQSWQKMILDELIPGMLAKGYHGVFLDTIDTAGYLENKNPIKYAGSVKSLVRLVKEMRARFADLVILPNNGLEILGQYADVIDGVVVEDLYAGYDFSQKKYQATLGENDAYKEKYLDAFIKQNDKAVLVILYGDNPDSKELQAAKARAKDKKYLTFVTTIGLGDLPPLR